MKNHSDIQLSSLLLTAAVTILGGYGIATLLLNLDRDRSETVSAGVAAATEAPDTSETAPQWATVVSHTEDATLSDSSRQAQVSGRRISVTSNVTPQTAGGLSVPVTVNVDHASLTTPLNELVRTVDRMARTQQEVLSRDVAAGQLSAEQTRTAERQEQRLDQVADSLELLTGSVKLLREESQEAVSSFNSEVSRSRHVDDVLGEVRQTLSRHQEILEALQQRPTAVVESVARSQVPDPEPSAAPAADDFDSADLFAEPVVDDSVTSGPKRNPTPAENVSQGIEFDIRSEESPDVSLPEPGDNVVEEAAEPSMIQQDEWQDSVPENVPDVPSPHVDHEPEVLLVPPVPDGSFGGDLSSARRTGQQQSESIRSDSGALSGIAHDARECSRDELLGLLHPSVDGTDAQPRQPVPALPALSPRPLRMPGFAGRGWRAEPGSLPPAAVAPVRVEQTFEFVLPPTTDPVQHLGTSRLISSSARQSVSSRRVTAGALKPAAAVTSVEQPLFVPAESLPAATPLHLLPGQPAAGGTRRLGPVRRAVSDSLDAATDLRDDLKDQAGSFLGRVPRPARSVSVDKSDRPSLLHRMGAAIRRVGRRPTVE